MSSGRGSNFRSRCRLNPASHSVELDQPIAQVVAMVRAAPTVLGAALAAGLTTKARAGAAMATGPTAAALAIAMATAAERRV